ncbi:MAG: hypothetical protein MHM6MM_003581 [Cercozoa sp. M6MM]
MELNGEIKLVGVLAVCWLAEVCSTILHASPIPLLLIAGAAIGPALWQQAPFPEALTAAGKLGVLLLVTHAGLSVDLADLRRVGVVRSALGAFAGVAAPVGFVFLAQLLFNGYPDSFEGGGDWRNTLAIGATLAPTSLGYVTTLLRQFELHTTSLGTFVAAAAVFDDVLSLVLLAEVQAVALKDDVSTWDVLSPLVASTAAILCGIVLLPTIPRVLPVLERATFKRFPFRNYDTENTREQFRLCLMLLVATGGAIAADAAGTSDLLGAFVAGLAFNKYPSVRRQFEAHGDFAMRWLVRLFFACTIGFSLPSLIDRDGEQTKFWKSGTLAKASILFACAFFGKLPVAAFAHKTTLRVRGAHTDPTERTLPIAQKVLVYALAMSGRGEFSFLLAKQASEDELLTDADVAACVLALLFICMLTPFLFLYVLHRATGSVQMVAPDDEMELERTPSSEILCPAVLDLVSEGGE